MGSIDIERLKREEEELLYYKQLASSRKIGDSSSQLPKFVEVKPQTTTTTTTTTTTIIETKKEEPTDYDAYMKNLSVLIRMFPDKNLTEMINALTESKGNLDSVVAMLSQPTSTIRTSNSNNNLNNSVNNNLNNNTNNTTSELTLKPSPNKQSAPNTPPKERETETEKATDPKVQEMISQLSTLFPSCPSEKIAQVLKDTHYVPDLAAAMILSGGDDLTLEKDREKNDNDVKKENNEKIEVKKDKGKQKVIEVESEDDDLVSVCPDSDDDSAYLPPTYNFSQKSIINNNGKNVNELYSTKPSAPEEFVVLDRTEISDVDWFKSAMMDDRGYRERKRKQEEEDRAFALKLHQEELNKGSNNNGNPVASSTEDLAWNQQVKEYQRAAEEEKSIRLAKELQEQEDSTVAEVLYNQFIENAKNQSQILRKQEEEDRKLATELVAKWQDEEANEKLVEEDRKLAEALQKFEDQDNAKPITPIAPPIPPPLPNPIYTPPQPTPIYLPPQPPVSIFNPPYNPNPFNPFGSNNNSFTNSLNVDEVSDDYMDITDPASSIARFDFRPADYFPDFHERVASKFSAIGYSNVTVSLAPTHEDVRKRFSAKWRELSLSSGGNRVFPVLCFHGTNVQNFPSIFQRGLLVPGQGREPIRVVHGSACGVGIYLAMNPSTSLGYVSGGTSMLVCAFLLDKKTVVTPNREVVVVFNSAQVMPCFVVNFGNSSSSIGFNNNNNNKRAFRGSRRR